MSIRSNKLFISILGVSTLLLAVIGATYAWFSVNIVNPTGSSMTVTVANLGVVTFVDGNSLDMEYILPGTSKTKSFSITRESSTGSVAVKYKIKMNITTNTLTSAADSQFVYTLTGSSGDGTLVNSSGTVPTATTYIGGTGSMTGNTTHSYTIKLEFKNTNSNQNSAMGKSFSGYLTVESAQNYSSGS